MTTNNGKETLVDTICDQIRRDIIGHVLLPGDRLRTKELAERYGVSETPVKLALNRLCTEKIIDNYPRQGMRVHEFTAEEVGETYDIRLMMDLYYVKEVIDTVEYNQVLRNELKRNVAEHMDLINQIDGNITRMEVFLRNYEFDNEFHELYLKCTGNQKILEVFRSINPFVYSNYIFLRQSREKDIQGVNGHKKILDAILAKDEELLKVCLKEHYEKSKKAIMLILKVEKML